MNAAGRVGDALTHEALLTHRVQPGRTLRNDSLLVCAPAMSASAADRVDRRSRVALRTGARSGAGFDSSGYGIYDDEDVGDGEGPAGGEGGVQRRRILDAALKHVVRCCGGVDSERRVPSSAIDRIVPCCDRLSRFTHIGRVPTLTRVHS